MFENKEEHPSFGMVGISHWQSSGTYLAGSEFQHQHGVSLTIKRAEKHRDLSRDWWFGTDELISINMSEAQLVELIGRPNMGDGVVCTLNHVMGERMPDPPNPQSLKGKYRADFQEDADRCVRELREALTELEQAIESGKIGKTALREIHQKIHYAACAVDSGIPFVAKQFESNMEKIINHAAAEIEATVTQTALRLGIEQMRSIANEGPKLLDESVSGDD